MRKPTFTAQLTQAEKDACRQAAANLGLITGRGKHPEWGSIEEMLQNIAGGEIVLLFHQHDEPEEMLATAKKLLDLAAPMHPHDNAGIMITSLAAALEHAAMIKTASNAPEEVPENYMDREEASSTFGERTVELADEYGFVESIDHEGEPFTLRKVKHYYVIE